MGRLSVEWITTLIWCPNCIAPQFGIGDECIDLYLMINVEWAGRLVEIGSFVVVSESGGWIWW